MSTTHYTTRTPCCMCYNIHIFRSQVMQGNHLPLYRMHLSKDYVCFRFLLGTSQSWISCLQMTVAGELSGVTTSALSLSSNTSIFHSHIKEQNGVVAIAAAVLCKPLLLRSRQKSYCCIHVPHHSGLFDGTDHCQDAVACTKQMVWLHETYRILHSVGMHTEKACAQVCPVSTCVFV